MNNKKIWQPKFELQSLWITLRTSIVAVTSFPQNKSVGKQYKLFHCADKQLSKTQIQHYLPGRGVYTVQYAQVGTPL